MKLTKQHNKSGVLAQAAVLFLVNYGESGTVFIKIPQLVLAFADAFGLLIRRPAEAVSSNLLYSSLKIGIGIAQNPVTIWAICIR